MLALKSRYALLHSFPFFIFVNSAKVRIVGQRSTSTELRKVGAPEEGLLVIDRSHQTFRGNSNETIFIGTHFLPARLTQDTKLKAKIDLLGIFNLYSCITVQYSVSLSSHQPWRIETTLYSPRRTVYPSLLSQEYGKCRTEIHTATGDSNDCARK